MKNATKQKKLTFSYQLAWCAVNFGLRLKEPPPPQSEALNPPKTKAEKGRKRERQKKAKKAEKQKKAKKQKSRKCKKTPKNKKTKKINF